MATTTPKAMPIKAKPVTTPAGPENTHVMIGLHNLKPSQSRHKYKRVGRGNSSGKGTTAGRGTKGQRARTGGRNKLTRRGMKHLVERTPKNRGFSSHSAKMRAVTLVQLQQAFTEGAVITPAMMKGAGLIAQTWPGVKVILAGDLKKKLTIQAHSFSAGAMAAITKVGGTASVLPRKDRTVAKSDHRGAKPSNK